jgi:hypothetical protein
LVDSVQEIYLIEGSDEGLNVLRICFCHFSLERKLTKSSRQFDAGESLKWKSHPDELPVGRVIRVEER